MLPNSISPSRSPPCPLSSGAYRVTVDVRSDGALVATGGTWMGRVAPRGGSLDLAFVWRAELGIHQDPQGRFFDTVVQEACATGGALPGLAGLSGRFPDWRFSLGIEPVLLTQLRDMADGYTRADGSEAGAVRWAPTIRRPRTPRRSLSAWPATPRSDTVEVAAAPYAGPDLGLLATQGWRDGFEQIQLGKQELVQTLGLGAPSVGRVLARSRPDQRQPGRLRSGVDRPRAGGRRSGRRSQRAAGRGHRGGQRP